MKTSVWDSYKDNINYKPLKENKYVDCVVIGGGICGILNAYKLVLSGKNVILIEKDTIASKVTLKTTATISLLQDFLYQDLIKNIGYKNSLDYVRYTKKAIQEFISLGEIFDIDFKVEPSIKYSFESEKLIEREIKALKSLNVECFEVDNDDYVIPFKKGLKVLESVTINPIKLINSLSKYINIYENTEVLKIKNKVIYLDNKTTIKANHIIVTTHFPIINNIYNSLRLTQYRSYVYAIKTNKKIDYNLIGDDIYLRSYKDLIIIGCCDHRVGFCYKKGFKQLDEYCEAYFKDYEILYKWFNQDLRSLDNIMYIYEKNNLYSVTGLNMWGFSNSLISANIITNRINRKIDKIPDVFKDRFSLNKEFLKHLLIVSFSLISFKTPRCKHLKAKLTYNEFDNTWDCKCHGSSFNKNLEVIYDPSNKDLD